MELAKSFKSIKTHIQKLDIPTKKIDIFKIVLSGLIGIVIGVFTSAVVNSTLVEISLNPFFSVYFGVVFLAIGSIILLRILSNPQYEGFQQRKPFLVLFGLLVILSGFVSFLLEKNWFKKFTYLEKVPLYIMISISLTFSMVFGIIDVINYCVGFFQASYARTIVETSAQIMCAMLLSVIMGLFYGLVFGIFDVEDSTSYDLQINLIHDEYSCLPVAAGLGWLGGCINEYLRFKGRPLYLGPIKDPFSEEI